MTVTINSSLSFKVHANSNEGTITQEFNCQGTDRLLVVSAYNYGNPYVGTTSVTYNGVSMTRVGVAAGYYGDTRLFILVNPPTGSHNIVITGYDAYWNCQAVCFENVDQSTPVGTAVTSTNSDSSSVSANITVVNAGSLIYNFVTGEGYWSPLSASNSQESICGYNDTNYGTSSAYKYYPSSTGSIAQGFSWGSSLRNALILLEINQATVTFIPQINYF